MKHSLVSWFSLSVLRYLRTKLLLIIQGCIITFCESHKRFCRVKLHSQISAGGSSQWINHWSLRDVKVHQHKSQSPCIKYNDTHWKVTVSSVRICDTVRFSGFGQQSWWLNPRRESSAYWFGPFVQPSITVEIFVGRRNSVTSQHYARYSVYSAHLVALLQRQKLITCTL